MPETNQEGQPGANIDSQPGAPQSQPGLLTSQPGTSVSQPGNFSHPDLGNTLSEINSNMGSMATLLKQIVERGSVLESPNASRSSQRKRQDPLSDLSDSEEDDETHHTIREKRARLTDELSIGAPSDDDLKELISDADGATKSDDVAETAKELDLLKTLEADFNEDEPTGPNIQQNLANIAMKRWEISLSSDKLKGLLAKHLKPGNCPELLVPKVNPEIWSQLENYRRKADLRLGNLQQTLQKATFGILNSCHQLVSEHGTNVSKEILAPAVDAIALLGHAASELSQLRREQVKPALKREFYSLCTATNESSTRSPLLFGTDLAKRIRDAKDANNIGNKIGAGSKNGGQRGSTRGSYSRHPDKKRPYKGYGYSDYKPSFLGKQKKPTHKKHQQGKK